MLFIKNLCVCGSLKATKLFEAADYNFNNTNEKADFLRCLDCGSIYPSIFVDESFLGDAYRKYYTTPKKRSGIRRLYRHLIDSMRKYYMIGGIPKKAKSILDYGCGSGEFLRRLIIFGYEGSLFGSDLFLPEGLDASEKINYISIDTLFSSKIKFDWITMNHVIEHSQNPEDIIDKLSCILNGDGGISIVTPNSDSYLIKSFKEYARDLDFPRHRQIFSRQAIEILLKGKGYDVQFISPPRINSILNHLSCMANVFKASDVKFQNKMLLLFFSILMTGVNFVKPAKYRDMSSPEIFLLARRKL